MDREEIFRKIRAVGRAALTADLENSHSGNISMRVRDAAGRDCLAITATGSQKGELTPDKICYPALTETNYGHYKASSETDIHAMILQLPGAKATVHGHTKWANVVTLDDEEMPKTNPRAALRPVDALGARHLVEVPVDWYPVACGSKEMADGIALRLKDRSACMVQAHGVFARGGSLEEALFNLCLSEHSGYVLHLLGLLGADLAGIRKKLDELRPWLDQALPAYGDEAHGRVDFADEPDTVELFLTEGFRAFESRYSPFHTGSMSIKTAGTLLYMPHAVMPHDLPGPMLELPLKGGDEAEARWGWDLKMSRIIYQETPLKALSHFYPAEVEAVSLSRLDDLGRGTPKIVPIDAEGGFLYPSVPILPPDPDPDLLVRALMDYKITAVAFGGVWAAGEQSVGETLRHVSSLKDISFYRIMAKSKKLNLERMEPERAKVW